MKRESATISWPCVASMAAASHAQLVGSCNGLLVNKVATVRLPAVQVQQMQEIRNILSLLASPQIRHSHFCEEDQQTANMSQFCW